MGHIEGTIVSCLTCLLQSFPQNSYLLVYDLGKFYYRFDRAPYTKLVNFNCDCSYKLGEKNCLVLVVQRECFANTQVSFTHKIFKKIQMLQEYILSYLQRSCSSCQPTTSDCSTNQWRIPYFLTFILYGLGCVNLVIFLMY